MAEPSATLNVFISYGRADSRDLALRLRDDLQAVGYAVWLDVSEIPGGASWSQQIEVAIEQCHVTLALMSAASFDSQWCRAEQLRAMRKGKRVIPVLVQPEAERPLHLEHLNFLDFSKEMRYDEMFRDLLSDIKSGVAFNLPAASHHSERRTHSKARPSVFKSRRRVASSRTYTDEKRTANVFRQVLADLRGEQWLGARYWWPYFVFYYADMRDVVKILKADELASPYAAGDDFNSRWDKFVRLYFRPRTPDLFRAEGFRSLPQQRTDAYTPMPVYLLFDLEAVICMPESRFSEGDIARLKKTFSGHTAFRDVPFNLIYHDSWFMPDEREEIMTARQAQALVPDRIGLESLQYIWCRSSAEYETLRTLLPSEVWRDWRDKVTARTDFNLFNRKWVYVESAVLEAGEVRLRFNPCDTDCGEFSAAATIEAEDGTRYTWSNDAFTAAADLVLEAPVKGRYTVRFTLDGDLAYAGQYQPELAVL